MKLSSASKGLALGAVAVGALLTCSQATAQQTPVGYNWDCTVNGAQGRGIAFLTFSEDYTFHGESIMTANRQIPDNGGGDSDNPRGSTSTDSRGDTDTSRTGTSGGVISGGTNGTVIASKNIYGFAPVDGRWQYDQTGKVIGFFKQVVQEGTSTNTAFVTNAIWFKATVKGQALTLVATTPDGKKSTYLGRPMRDMPDLSGSWYGKQRGTGQKLLEFFELAPTEQFGLYVLTGEGAAYTTQGYVMLSSTKRIGIAVQTDAEVLRSTVGAFYPRLSQALTSGVMDPGYQVLFNAFHYPPAY